VPVPQEINPAARRTNNKSVLILFGMIFLSEAETGPRLYPQV
jgi:hypothetical protein